MAEFDDQGRPVPPKGSAASAGPENARPAPGAPSGGAGPVSASFDLNHPTIISLLYLSSFVLFITGIVGLVLAYVWRSEDHAGWETSHYTYHIRTFWIGLLGIAISAVLMILLVGFLLMLAVAVWVIVRSVLALVNAQKKEPMPNPETWLV